MKRWIKMSGILFIGCLIGYSTVQYKLLEPTSVVAAMQNLFFNSVRVGTALPPTRDFFGTGDLIASRRTFTTDVVAGALAAADGEPTPGRLRVRDKEGRDLIEATAMNDLGGSIVVRGADGSTTVRIDGGVSGGRIVLNGRALDFAEVFDLREADSLKPGEVVVIDSEHPGRLRRATRAYDPRVAGIIAGANGLRSGILLGGQQEDNSHKPVALSGRVYCWADAAYGKIEPGDLLTTSPTPGHAMRVSDSARSNGAILGKALGRLDRRRGKILVLLSLS